MTTSSRPCDHCGTLATPGSTCPKCRSYIFDDDPLGESSSASPSPAPEVPQQPAVVAVAPVVASGLEVERSPAVGATSGVALRAPRESRPVLGHGTDPLKREKRAMLVAAGAFLLLWLLSWALQGDGPSGADVHQALRSDPRQTPTERPPFEFEYYDHRYEVQPVADYELSGLVVTHNDPDGFGDIYHDETSVDTRDLCVIWGGNVVSGEYRDMDFESGAWTCRVSYGPGVRFFGQQLSNNHLITNDESIRDKIADVRIGDEVRIKGMLVNYRSPTRRTNWRNSSTIRTDTGNGACEVIFVEQLEILSRGTPIWYAIHTFSGWALALLLLGQIAVFVYQVKRESSGGVA